LGPIFSFASTSSFNPYLDGRILAKETRVVLDDLVCLGLVEEVDQLQKFLQGELVERCFVTRQIVIRN
jgi:hypothetical protein